MDEGSRFMILYDPTVWKILKGVAVMVDVRSEGATCVYMSYLVCGHAASLQSLDVFTFSYSRPL